ncbi:MAG: bifunctional homocysteine S-methyltransferase/methylenetetrahydrofolate reductase [Eubacteriales bacterium]|nr:bifunctional homocysteine S-methyltransferase/methylenetetrahydrofolate reductase [Eubacteriales bacterium]
MKRVIQPLLFDGAFGTYYARLTGSHGACEPANLADPVTVARIHREYRAAGAQALKTNTFAANRFALNLPREQVSDILAAGWALAQGEADGAQVYADIGPVNAPPEEALAELKAIGDTFLALGADHFLLETFPEADSPLALAQYIKERCPQAQILLCFAVDQDGFSRQGAFCADLLERAAASEAVFAAGLNCICGPSHMKRLLRRLNGLASVALPNAGYPGLVNGRLTYLDNAAYFAQKLGEMREMGVPVLGGCCGTTPEHIRLAVQELAQRLPGAAPLPGETAVARDEPTTPFARLLAGGKRVIAVELDPPEEDDWGNLSKKALGLKAAGADLLTVADSPLARARADSVLTAARLHRETGLPAMPHITCRDRNPLAMKAALLGAALEDVRDVLAITGDPVAPTDRGDVRGVFSFHSQSLMEFIGRLNRDVFAAHPLHYGGALNLNALRFDPELARAQKKEAAGAAFFLTQPVFSPEAVENLRLARRKLTSPILVGIFPLAGYRNAVFLNNEVPGIQIPADVVESFRELTPAQAREHTLELAVSIATQTAPYCSGYYIMTPLRRTSTVRRLIEAIRRNGL